MLPDSLTLALSPADGADDTGGFAVDLLVLLATSGLVAILGRRLRLATVAGYLIAGTLIGPHALGLVQQTERTEAIAHLATILLMFTIGLHLDLSGLRGGLMPTLGVGVISTILVALVGWPVAMAFGGSAPGALAIAMALSMSSTAVVLRVLEQRRELHGLRGRLVFGVLLVQDMLALAFMATLPLLAAWAAGTQSGAMRAPDGTGLPLHQEHLLLAAKAIGGIITMIALGRLVFPRLLGEAARGASSEVLLVVSAALALGAAVFTGWLGFSPELGAFLAGFLLAGTPFRYQLAGQLAPLRDLFLAVFFTAVGLQLRLGDVAADWWLIMLGVGATLIVKSVVIGGAAWAGGATGAVAVYSGVALAQGGEFSLVILGQAVLEGRRIIDNTAFAHAVAVVVVSLMITPALLETARWLAERAGRIRPAPWIRASALRGDGPDAKHPAEPLLHAEADGSESPDEAGLHPTAARAGASAPTPGTGLGGRAIVAGFGPVGRAVADVLERRAISLTIIELNPRTVRRQSGLGRRMVYGDASNPEVLESAGLAEADAVILTMPDEEATLQACRVIRGLRPDIFIAARANVLSKALQAMQLGADHVVVEELAAAEAMAAQVLQKIQQRAAGAEAGPRLYDFPPIGKK